MTINQVKPNPFVDALSNTQRVSTASNIKQVKYGSTMYKDTYILDISAKGKEYQKLYENDDYPIIDKDVFSYKKSLALIYKDLNSYFSI